MPVYLGGRSHELRHDLVILEAWVAKRIAPGPHQFGAVSRSWAPEAPRTSSSRMSSSVMASTKIFCRCRGGRPIAISSASDSCGTGAQKEASRATVSARTSQLVRIVAAAYHLAAIAAGPELDLQSQRVHAASGSSAAHALSTAWPRPIRTHILNAGDGVVEIAEHVVQVVQTLDGGHVCGAGSCAPRRGSPTPAAPALCQCPGLPRAAVSGPVGGLYGRPGRVPPPATSPTRDASRRGKLARKVLL